MTPRTLLIGCGLLVALVLVFFLGVIIAPNIHVSFGPQTTGATVNTPTTPTGGNTPIISTTDTSTPTPHSGDGPINGPDGQDFPGTATGPAIVEWYGDVSCGTFKLPVGEAFTWNRTQGGHYWNYRTQADVDAAWSDHVTKFNNKPFNQQHACQVDVRP